MTTIRDKKSSASDLLEELRYVHLWLFFVWGGGLSITRFSPTHWPHFSAIISPIQICISDMKTIQYGLLVFRQKDEVSVDGMDVHAVAYQRL